MKATITSLIFLLLSLTVSSQTYKYIGIEEGLSNQKIYKIQKDARGYMWFLTHVGIDQYNGKEIKHYKLREGNRELDPLLNINWTFLDKTGTLLVTGKQGRIFRYDSGHDRFVYNPQNEMFRLLGTKRSFSQNETFFFSHPYPALFRLISHF